MAYLWPGLPHLWVRGSWAGLALAVGFTALLHTTVLATLVWPEWLSPRVSTGCGAALGLLWLAAFLETRGELRRLAAEKQAAEMAREAETQADSESDAPSSMADPLEALLVEAQKLYLQADWVATERKLLELLRQDGEDVEAQLLLATLWRRTGREADARRRLRRLGRREAAAGWQFEIDAELRLCEPPAAVDEDAEALAESPPTEGTSPSSPHEPLKTLQLTDAAHSQPRGTDRKAA